MKNRQLFLRDEKGFSMIEVMVVIGLIVIIAAIGIPTFSQWVPNYQLKQAAYDIFSTMQRAKAEAVRTNSEQTITFDPGNQNYTKADGVTVVNLPDFGSGIEFGHGNATKEAGSTGGTDFDNEVTYPGDNVTFKPRGMAENGFIYIQNNKDKTYAVGSLQSGIIRIRRWTGSDWE